MPDKLSTLIRYRRGSLPLLIILCVLILVIAIVRLDTIPGIILSYLATTILAVALTHKWRKKRMFIMLMVASFVVFFFLAFVHEVVYDPNLMTSAVAAWQRYMMWFFHMAVSIIVAFVCPVGFVTGAAGSVILWMRRGRASNLTGT